MEAVIERRFVSSSPVRSAAPTHFSSSPGTLTAYAATYHTLSSDLGSFRERIAPGCFDRAISEGDDVRCLVNHSADMIVGRTRNGTLRLTSDAKGLHTTCILPDTSVARDLLENVRCGNISECSFGFIPEDESWSLEDDPDDRTQRVNVRTLRAVRLLDTSYVVYPAYPGTSVSVGPGSERSHSFEELFPDGAPREIRSRLGDVRLLWQRAHERRTNLVNRVLSI